MKTERKEEKTTTSVSNDSLGRRDDEDRKKRRRADVGGGMGGGMGEVPVSNDSFVGRDSSVGRPPDRKARRSTDAGLSLR